MVPGFGYARRLARRLSPRTGREIVWTPQSGLGFGNLLYAYLYAATERSRGRDCWVLSAPVMKQWLTHFPSLEALTTVPSEVGWRDQREWIWRDRYGIDFTRSELDTFVKGHLGPVSTPAAEASRVIVNVRRGDYYEQPHLRGTYSFDIAAYADIALQRISARGPIHEISFVSDGLDWCRLKLDDLSRRYSSTVTFQPRSAYESFVAVTSARRVVGTNSTFSYWGGYVSSYLYRRNAHIVMPRFHARLGADWSAYQLDPTWDVVDDIPGGWNA